MSLESFQQAFGDLIASPKLCLLLRSNPDEVLSNYDLSPREQRRLTAIVNQPGMSTNCTLYRANRLTAIYTLMPLTCVLLDSDLKGELDLYAETNQNRDLQFKQESERFARFITQRVLTGQLQNEYILEVIDYELAKNDLMYLSQRRSWPDSDKSRITEFDISDVTRDQFVLHPLTRLVYFKHDPAILIGLLGNMRIPPKAMAEGDFCLLLDARGEEIMVMALDETARLILRTMSAGSYSVDSDEALANLLGFLQADIVRIICKPSPRT